LLIRRPIAPWAVRRPNQGTLCLHAPHQRRCQLVRAEMLQSPPCRAVQVNGMAAPRNRPDSRSPRLSPRASGPHHADRQLDGRTSATGLDAPIVAAAAAKITRFARQKPLPEQPPRAGSNQGDQQTRNQKLGRQHKLVSTEAVILLGRWLARLSCRSF